MDPAFLFLLLFFIPLSGGEDYYSYVGAVSEAAATAVAKASQTGWLAKRRRRN